MDRRAFLRRGIAELARSLARTAAVAADEAGVRLAGGRRYLRPPGALPEAAFLLACTRCRDCGEACPAGAIRFLDTGAGLAAGTPYLDPAESPCRHCLRCVAACPSGALVRLSDPRQIRIGVARIDPDTCWAHRGRFCDVCYGVCPFPDAAIRLEGGRPAINPDACTGCGQCAYVCPSTPGSITIVPD